MIQIPREVKVNDEKTLWSINKIKTAMIVKQSLIKRAPLAACRRLSFKPNINDFMEPLAAKTIDSLINQGINLIVEDRYLQEDLRCKLRAQEHALKNVGMLSFFVKHQEFQKIKSLEIHKNQAKIIDLCGLSLAPLSVIERTYGTINLLNLTSIFIYLENIC